MNHFKLMVSCGFALLLFGCASGGKTDLDVAIDPQPSVAEAEQLPVQADAGQADLLSLKEYTRAMQNLEKARQGLASDYNADYILTRADAAKSALQQALENTRTRTPKVSRILVVRQSALGAGLKNSAALIEDLADLDDDLRSETENFSQALVPQIFSEFQKKYLALEIRAVQFRELNSVEKAIASAVRADADDLAPKTLMKAQLDVSDAGNMIAQSPRDSSVHREAVKEAEASSVLLADVMKVIRETPGTPENVALKVVRQNRELASLSSNVGALEQNLESTESNLKKSEATLLAQDQELKSTRSNLVESENNLKQQNRALAKTSIQVRFQKAMDEAVRQFSVDEAEVYQQGNKLILRLKRINFASGIATLPESSKPLLAKIDKLIKSIDAEIVDVQGHTDSIGPDNVNSKLSNDRAVAVARHLASLQGGYRLRYSGYGESRPIASNETEEGRAINRRVDLEVTARKISG